MKMIEHNHFICHLILGTFTEYPFCTKDSASMPVLSELILILFEIFARRNTKLLLEAF